MFRYQGERDLDPSSQGSHGRLTIIQSLQTVCQELEELEELLNDATEESFRVPSVESATPGKDGLLDLLRMRKLGVDFIHPGTRVIDFDKVKIYEAVWAQIPDAIMYLHSTTWKTRGARWDLWIAKLESTAETAWKKMVASSRVVICCENDIAWNVALRRFHVVDELLDRLSKPGETRKKFAEELDDSL